MFKHFFKRLLDILISGIALLCISWFLILVAIFLHFANKGAGGAAEEDGEVGIWNCERLTTIIMSMLE